MTAHEDRDEAVRVAAEAICQPPCEGCLDLARAYIAAIPVWRCCPAGSWQPSVCAAWGQHDVGLHDVGHLTESEEA